MSDLVRARALLARLPMRAPADGASPASQVGARILIVEDDYIVGIDLEHRLTEAGYEVVGIAASASDAVTMAATEKPALAIVDVRLTGAGDGIDAAIEMFDRLGVRSIFATAHGDAAIRKRAERARPVGWLLKPYSPQALIDVVKAALQAS